MGCSSYFAAISIHPLVPLNITEATYLLPPPSFFISSTDLIVHHAIALQKCKADLTSLHSKIYEARIQAAIKFKCDHIATIHNFDFQQLSRTNSGSHRRRHTFPRIRTRSIVHCSFSRSTSYSSRPTTTTDMLPMSFTSNCYYNITTTSAKFTHPQGPLVLYIILSKFRQGLLQSTDLISVRRSTGPGPLKTGKQTKSRSEQLAYPTPVLFPWPDSIVRSELGLYTYCSMLRSLVSRSRNLYTRPILHRRSISQTANWRELLFMDSRKPLNFHSGPLVWIDCEMTGLNPQKDKIMEVAVLITNGKLETVDDGIEYVVRTDKKYLNGMDEWCTNQHGSTGLTQACLESPHSLSEVQDAVLNYIKLWIPDQRVGILAGNSVHADRSFLVKEMPAVIDWLHYRIFVISNDYKFFYRQMFRQSKNCTAGGIPIVLSPKVSLERADTGVVLRDLSVDPELQWYRDNIFVSPNTPPTT
ncbi:hypothetical protein EW146_g9837 [Bondarzewia mesenterica]|uniref:Exonuclease domain-containing protein n=1 Tax=Bondarzewia mesenterica TaxID=1095465 RepID=A0A4S4L2V2_9AGAM|nr:hypothetical protein EW146_g9837 [Bondarzewia mesenterica]